MKNKKVKHISNYKDILNFLDKLGYIEEKHYKILIPVFSSEDKKTMDKVIRIVTKTACDFISRKHEEIKTALGETQPILNKISMNEIFMMFGTRYLVIAICISLTKD